MRYPLLIGIWLMVQAVSWGQDPFFIHFYNNESTYNPALVGYRGALSVMMKYKSQWAGLGSARFRTGNLAVEESLPCSIFDYGLNVRFDEEGAGIFRTRDFAFRFAGVVPFDVGASRHNLRMGAGFQWSYKSIDYNRLYFSDELDPKYGLTDALGLDLPTNFVPPNDGRSLWFFSPSVGLTHRILFNADNPRSPTLHYGVAVHNAFSLGKDEFTGNEESILQIGTKIARRWSAFGTLEFLPYMQRGTFFSIKPSVLYENQGGLAYWEAGAKFSLNRLLALGCYYH
ncbi:MAG: type IX secretion system membrane protein PorP/SprF, partial [Lewinella sp.]|nr:type IX secretion system membrane protein PorP/SprF [Lewinella sp.]